MRKKLLFALTIAILSIYLVSCGWNPKVTAVPVTAPWNAMNLPIKENAVVWKSEPNEFRAVHKEDKKTITKNYTDVFKGQGWKVSKFDEVGDRYYVGMSKDEEQIQLEFYDFDNTGVLIEKK